VTRWFTVLILFRNSGRWLFRLNCNPVPRETRRHPHEARPGWLGLASADSRCHLEPEIALGGVPAKVQPQRLIQPRRRCVETSVDVIQTHPIRNSPARLDLFPTIFRTNHRVHIANGQPWWTVIARRRDKILAEVAFSFR
jgi:hypothetical protein